jgi:serine/threonine protein kinase
MKQIFCKSDKNQKKQLQMINEQKKDFKTIKEHFKNIDNMREFLKEGCQDFNYNFELLNFVNSGSCGVVYEGKLKKCPNKHVGLKFLMGKIHEEKRDKNANQKKLKELYFQRKLHHKNITGLYGFYEIKNCSCIAMDYAKYGDLEYFQKKLIQKKYLSETLIAYITIQILEGLKYCHQCKIIHMDIKQQNILIDENLNIKITDFSVSQSYEQYKEGQKFNLPLAGTSLYMSPEVLAKNEIDVEDCNKIDMFSLGILLYNSAFGQFPFQLEYSDRKNFKAIYDKIMQKNLVFPTIKSYSFLFKNFLRGLLNKNIKNRYSINDALEDPWIKGTKLIFKDKEKMYDLEKFLINIVTDNIKSFNDYLKNYKTEVTTSISSSN